MHQVDWLIGFQWCEFMYTSSINSCGEGNHQVRTGGQSDWLRQTGPYAVRWLDSVSFFHTNTTQQSVGSLFRLSLCIPKHTDVLWMHTLAMDSALQSDEATQKVSRGDWQPLISVALFSDRSKWVCSVKTTIFVSWICLNSRAFFVIWKQ